MRKYLTLLFLIVAFLTLSSCGEKEHTHEYGEDYKYNETHHWNECTVDGCSEKSNQALHEMVGNKCNVCDYINEEVVIVPEHTHEYGEEYKFNETAHWHGCTIEGCSEKENVSEHQFGNPKITYTDKLMTIVKCCVDCGYETKEEVEIDSNVDNAVEWNEMFESFKLTNYSLNICFQKDENGKWITTNHCEIGDDGVFYHMGDYPIGYTKTLDGETYTTYVKTYLSKTFVKVDDQTSIYYDNLITETALVISFVDNFEKFTYNAEKGTYECNEIIQARAYSLLSEEYDTIYCHNSIVTVVDGKIISICAEYSFKSLDASISYFEYYNIGATVITIPESVINEAITESEYKDMISGGNSNGSSGSSSEGGSANN